jgi:hypothetical protein
MAMATRKSVKDDTTLLKWRATLKSVKDDTTLLKWRWQHSRALKMSTLQSGKDDTSTAEMTMSTLKSRRYSAGVNSRAVKKFNTAGNDDLNTPDR